MQTVMMFPENTPRVESMKAHLDAEHAITVQVLSDPIITLHVFFKMYDDNQIRTILVYGDGGNAALYTRNYVNGKRTDRCVKISKVAKQQSEVETMLKAVLEAAHERIADMKAGVIAPYSESVN